MNFKDFYNGISLFKKTVLAWKVLFYSSKHAFCLIVVNHPESRVPTTHIFYRVWGEEKQEGSSSLNTTVNEWFILRAADKIYSSIFHKMLWEEENTWLIIEPPQNVEYTSWSFNWKPTCLKFFGKKKCFEMAFTNITTESRTSVLLLHSLLTFACLWASNN